MVAIDPVIESIKRNSKVSKDLALLFISRVLMRVSLGALGVFLPVFLYESFGPALQSDKAAIQVVILIFLGIYALHLLLAPVASALFHRLGMRRMMAIGIFMASLSIVSLYFFDTWGKLNYTVAALSILFYIIATGVYRTLYWVPYHVDLAHELDSTSRSKQLAAMANLSDLLVVFAPMLGGVAIAFFEGFAQVFVIASFLMILAILPLLFMSDVYEYYSWTYLETFKKLFSKENRSLFIAQAANGAQTIAALFFWPIYVYIISHKQYVILGAVTSLTIIFIMFLRWLVGKWMDKHSRNKALWAGVLLSATGWFMKIFVYTPVQAVFVDTYHRMGRAVNNLTFNAVTYEQSADSGTYIDEYTTLKEMAMNIGRIAMLLAVGLAIYFLGVNLRFAFLVAALATFLMIFLDSFNRLR